MIILRKIMTPNDMIDNYIENQEYNYEYQLYDRNTIKTLMEDWAEYMMTEDKTKYLNPVKWNPETSNWE